MPDTKFFGTLERDTKALSRELTQGWLQEEIAAIRGDIEYREWGLALEHLAGAIVRLNKPLTPELLARIDDLARRMHMTRSTYWRALHAHARQLGIRAQVG
jgi:hypothetical protein